MWFVGTENSFVQKYNITQDSDNKNTEHQVRNTYVEMITTHTQFPFKTMEIVQFVVPCQQ